MLTALLFLCMIMHVYEDVALPWGTLDYTTTTPGDLCKESYLILYCELICDLLKYINLKILRSCTLIRENQWIFSNLAVINIGNGSLKWLIWWLATQIKSHLISEISDTYTEPVAGNISENIFSIERIIRSLNYRWNDIGIYLKNAF